MRVTIALVACAATFVVACHVEHDGSFEHDAGFVAASASVAVQIGHPPPPITTTSPTSTVAAGAPTVAPTTSSRVSPRRCPQGYLIAPEPMNAMRFDGGKYEEFCGKVCNYDRECDGRTCSFYGSMSATGDFMLTPPDGPIRVCSPN